MKKSLFKRISAALMVCAVLAGTMAACSGGGSASTAAESSGSEKSEAKDESEDESASGDKGSESSDGKAGGGDIDTSQELELKMYLLGDTPADIDVVYDEINARMKDEINATLNLSFLSWAEHNQKYPLLFSSGEDFDLIFTASQWAHYEVTAARKGYLPLQEDFIQTYAPGIWETVPEEAWMQAKIGGEVYMVPNTHIEFGYGYAAIRGDLAEKYGFEDINSYDEMLAYYDAIAENETGLTPLGAPSAGALNRNAALGYAGVGGTPGEQADFFKYIVTEEDNSEVISFIESDYFKEYAHEMKEMADKGYWTRDALSTQESNGEGFIAGTAASMFWSAANVANYCVQANEENPDWNCTIVDVTPDAPRTVNPYINGGMAINATSKNPERSMMALNVLMTNKEVYDMTNFGIVGTHWEPVGDDQYELLPASENFGNYCCWGWNNEDLWRTRYEEDRNPIRVLEDEIFEECLEKKIDAHPLLTFTFDNTAVKSECAVLETIYAQYLRPIQCGYTEDVDAAVDELIAKAKEAGLDKVHEEIQSQADEYVESLK